MKDLSLETDLSSDESEGSNLAFKKSESSGSESNKTSSPTDAPAAGGGRNEVMDSSCKPIAGAAATPPVESEPEKPANKAVPKTSIDDFDILKLLGKGAYGKVYQVRKTSGLGAGRIYAMKAMNKARICGSKTDVRHTKAERNVLVSVNHMFIVRLHFAFETPKRLYLVQEFCCGGELFRRMEVERLMLENDAQFYLREILVALEYLHENDIIYRDLKTENVMLDRTGHVKLIDFGLSKTNMRDDCLTKTFCGTVEYMAPEVILRNGYGKPADWWSFGIFTFDLLTGRSPFHSNQGKQATKDRILKGKYNSPRILTPLATDFVRRLLRKNIERRLGTRLGAAELKSHGFFKGTDWEKVLSREYEPPFTPHIQSDTDVRNFDEQFTSRTPRESNSVPADRQADQSQNQDPIHFDDFDFVSDEFLEQMSSASSGFCGDSRQSSTSASAPSDCENPECEANSLEQIDKLRICSCGT